MKRRPALSVVLISISLILCIVAAYVFIGDFFEVPSIKTYCYNCYGQKISYQPGTPISKEYKECVLLNAKFFLEKDFEQTKDLSKSFLTLLSGLLVGSITFSEKIINIQSSVRSARLLMIGCWIFLFIAIITCGVGLTLMTMASGWAAYKPFLDFRVFETHAEYLFIWSGLLFGIGMACLLIAGIISIHVHREPPPEGLAAG